MNSKLVKLNEFLFKVNRPCVFKSILVQEGDRNSACEWTFENLTNVFQNQTLTFRIGKKFGSDIQFENQCEYVEATIDEFLEWANSSELEKTAKRSKLNDSVTKSPFEDFDLDKNWAYADYKYMIELIDSKTKIKPFCIDWSAFGFEGRNAKESTLWIGTPGAYTPCHYDSYGYNLVAQIYGKKRWIIFSPNDSANLKSQRVPFEESTVYSSTNIKSPDLKANSCFKNSKPYVVELEPGDVLYVPHKWWHYVESLTNSISINTWVELEVDDRCRLKEIVTKTLVQSIMDSNLIGYERWLNSFETYNSQEDNVLKVKECLEIVKSNKTKVTKSDFEDTLDCEEMLKVHQNFDKFVERLDFWKFLQLYSFKSLDDSPNVEENDEDVAFSKLVVLANAAADPRVIEIIAENLLDSDF